MQVLKDWAQADRDAYERLCEHRGCTCFISAPCVCCTHPGNPLNQESDNECWEEVFDLDEACEKAMERIKRQIGESCDQHKLDLLRAGWHATNEMHLRHAKLINFEVWARSAWMRHALNTGRWLGSEGVVL